MHASAAATEAAIPASVWVALLVAAIALVGVLVGQAITLHNARAQRRGEQTKSVRDEVQVLMMVFFDFAEFARITPAPREMADKAEPYDEEWDRVAGPLAAAAANMAGRGKHRDSALDLMDGLGLQERAWREGESIGALPNIGYTQMAWAGFEIVAAWLRGERMPRHARGVALAARKMRGALEAEYRTRELNEDKNHKTGVLRRAWRRGRRSVRAHWRKWIAKPLRASWAFLFAA